MKNQEFASDSVMVGGVARLEELLQRREQRLKRLRRELSRRTPGGSNWTKTREKIGKLEIKVERLKRHIKRVRHTYGESAGKGDIQ